MKEKILRLMKSKFSKKLVFLLGVIFLILTLFITFDPKPFLKYGYVGVFAFNLFGPGTLLIPTLSRYMNIPLLAAVTALGMAFNDSVAWIIGNDSQVFVGKPEKLSKIKNSVEKYGMWALFFWSFIPIPYDFVGFVAGYLNIPYKKYILPTFGGKFIRFILIGYGVIQIFGSFQK